MKGAPVNVSGIAITKNSNRNNAIELIKYLTTDEAQKTYVNNTYEYSVNPNIMPDEIVQASKFKRSSRSKYACIGKGRGNQNI